MAKPGFLSLYVLFMLTFLIPYLTLIYNDIFWEETTLSNFTDTKKKIGKRKAHIAD